MITASEETLSIFHAGEFWEGINALGKEHIARKLRSLRGVSPTDAIAITKSQVEIEFWENLSGLRELVERYAEKSASAIRQPGAK